MNICLRRLALATAILVLTGTLTACRRESDTSGASGSNKGSLVLYCATDREIAQDLIDEFQKETGIRIDAKFDTEAAKAVGLIQAIRQEKAHPQCDVLWGGGSFFSTILENDGCLAPVPQDLIQSHGNAPRDARGRWLGFAASYRVLIVNTNDMPPGTWPHSYRDLINPEYKSRIGIANPLFGGMSAHVAALFSILGENGGREWLAALKQNSCAICAGMADVRDRVASGELWFGITSTIDAHVAVDGGKPVAIVYPDQQPGEIGSLLGYNTVALIANSPHPKEAEQFLRFLMTMKTEKILADGPGQTVGMLPESVSQDVGPAWMPRHLHTMNVDWDDAVKEHPAANAAIKQVLLAQ